MKNKYYVFGFILLIIGLSFGIFLYYNSTLKNESDTILKLNTVSTGSTSNGGVQIELTPKKISLGKLEVEIVMNTHSVDLSRFNLKEITMLEYEGKQLMPYSAPNLMGHHISGTLIFEVMDNELDSFRIVILGIPKVEKRIFEWEVIG